MFQFILSALGWDTRKPSATQNAELSDGDLEQIAAGKQNGNTTRRQRRSNTPTMASVGSAQRSAASKPSGGSCSGGQCSR